MNTHMLWLNKRLGGKRFINIHKIMDDFFHQSQVSINIFMIFTGDIYFASALKI